MPAFPTSSQDVTPDWLTAALGGPEALDGARVTGIEIERVGEGVGFMAIVSRLSLTYDRPCSAPGAVICKFPSPEPGARQVADTFRHYEKEVRFYEQMAAKSPVHAPRAYFHAFDEGSGDFALLMEDLAPRRNGDQVAGLSLADARSAVAALGRLQARWWEAQDLDAVAWLPAFDDASLAPLEPVFQQCWAPYRAFMGDRLSPDMLAVGDALSTRIRRIQTHLAQGPRTLVHGDFRADNFFFGEADAPPAIVDWQIVIKGRGGFDLAYLLTGNLTVEDRRANETELVQLYHSALCAGGVTGWSAKDAWRDYRTCAVFAWIWPVIAIGSLDPANERGVAFFFEWSKRVCTAIADLEAAEVLNDF